MQGSCSNEVTCRVGLQVMRRDGGGAPKVATGCLPRDPNLATKTLPPCLPRPCSPVRTPTQWSNLWSDDLPFGACCLLMAFDALLYSGVAWYLGRVGVAGGNAVLWLLASPLMPPWPKHNPCTHEEAL